MVANVGEGSVVLRPAAPREAIVDVAAAVGEALRFPLEGPPLEDVVRGASRVTIVIELPSLPIPGAPVDPRQAAVEGASDELERAGVPTESQTLLVAGGLARRPGPADIGLLVRPEFRRRFRGRVVVHDAEGTLAELDGGSSVPLRVNRALVETDAVVVVTAAETVVHGGPSALVAAAAPDLVRAAGAWSLLETAASQGWQLAVAHRARACGAHAGDRSLARAQPPAAARDDACAAFPSSRAQPTASPPRRSAGCSGSCRHRCAPACCARSGAN